MDTTASIRALNILQGELREAVTGLDATTRAHHACAADHHQRLTAIEECLVVHEARLALIIDALDSALPA